MFKAVTFRDWVNDQIVPGRTAAALSLDAYVRLSENLSPPIYSHECTVFESARSKFYNFSVHSIHNLTRYRRDSNKILSLSSREL